MRGGTAPAIAARASAALLSSVCSGLLEWSHFLCRLNASSLLR